jgi:hypothetical protein
MNRTTFFAIAIAATATIASCIKPEKSSCEADIVGFSINGLTPVAEPDFNPNEVVIKISESDWPSVVETDALLTPTLTLSEGATVQPPSGTPVKLSSAQYIVTAQDGHTTKIYTITAIKEYAGDTLYFPFDEWKVKDGEGYNILSDVSWSNGNPGVSMGLGLMGRPLIPASYPSQMSDEAVLGKAVRLETKQGGTIMSMQVPVWSGNCFLGNFNTKAVLDPLKATEFGRSTRRKPQSLYGYYKYTQGSGKYNEHAELIDRPDSCDIYAVFYRADADDGSDVTLSAYDIGTSPYVVARADLPDGSTTAGNSFHEFHLDFVYRDGAIVDFDNHRYKLAVVFASSSVGAALRGNPPTVYYAGKVGSVLLVDEVRVVNFPK